MKNLHILTLHWNHIEKLTALKESFIPTLTLLPKQYKINWLIKDNKSADNSVEVIKSWNEPMITLYEYPNNNQNFSEGMNYLFSKTSADDEDYILLLNNDVVFNDTKSLQNMINIMNDDSVGVVGCRLLYKDSDKLQHAGVCFNKHKNPYHINSGIVSNKDSLKNREFQAVTGAVLLTKAKYYKNAYTNKDGNKGLNQDLRWSFDDIFFTLSIKYNLGKKIVYCGNTNIYHEESVSLKKNPVNKMFQQHNLNILHSTWNDKIIVDDHLYLNNPNYNLYK